MSIKPVLLLTPLRRFSDLALLLLRVAVGAFLIWGVWDNLSSAARMHEFAQFLAKFKFPNPTLLAPLCAWAQFAVGVCFIFGVLTRWAGLACAFIFIVAIVMVDRFSGIRAMFPAASLVAIGIYLATHGSGRFGIDARLESR
jgi:putative oxidoreductase